MNDIQTLVLDCDGVLTDGRLFVDPASGAELRAFHVHDGFAIRMFMSSGGHVIICSGKGGGGITHRAAALGIQHVITDSRDKLADIDAVLNQLGVTWSDTAVVGDDFPDVPAMRRCGLPIATANARPEVQAIAKFITNRDGGDGAVRQVVELLLQQAGEWDSVLRRYALVDDQSLDRDSAPIA